MLANLLLCLMPLGCAATAWSQTVDLLADTSRWTCGIDKGETKMVMAPGDEARLAVTITADGGPEDYPKLNTFWSEPQDFRKFMRIRSRFRLTCSDPTVKEKRMSFVFYDELTRREDLPDRPMTQQCIAHSVPVGKWVEFSDWLLSINRSTIRALAVYLYEEPADPGQEYRWEIAQLQLEGVGETAVMLDGEIFAQEKVRGARGEPAGSIRTEDGLELVLGTAGEVQRVLLDGQEVGAATETAPCGLLVRDVRQTDVPPVLAGGTMEQDGTALRQTAQLQQLGLAVQATYRSLGQMLAISGSVTDLRGEDRAVTVYFALPLADGAWRWWDSVAASRSGEGEPAELAWLETGMGFGLNGAHSKYPTSALTLPNRAGLSLAIRMDEPVIFRTIYNPRLRLFFIAFDFGLVPEQAADGRSLATAPFQVLLYRHDPAWGMRSALQRYYDFFPEFFTKRVQIEGGWKVWGDASRVPGVKEAGFGFHWGPGGVDAVKWDNVNGLLALLYIEPEFYQQTMGDYDRAPTLAEALERMRLIAAGDGEELAKFEKLSYAYGYAPGSWQHEHSARASMVAVARAAVASVSHQADGAPYGQVGQYPWMGESKWGVIFPCNLDFDIPDGKGRFCRDVYLEYGLREMQDAGAHYDGIALDSFGGYGQWARVDYRRENFRYAHVPLSFSAAERVPVQVASFCSVEWLRKLAEEYHARGLVFMTNCAWGFAPGWLTFAAPYLDIFGAESPSFGDPEYMRAIAYRKPLTDLPYTPRPEWEVAWHLLLDIYPGDGNDMAVMARHAALLRQLSAAGWEPLTLVRAEPDSVRLERYGSGDGTLLSVYNPAGRAVTVRLRVDAAALGLLQVAAEVLPDGDRAEVDGNAIMLTLEAKETVVMRLRNA